jgi:hypothetical protein
VPRVIACALSALLVCAPSLARAAGPDQPSPKKEAVKNAAPQPTAKNKGRPSVGSGGDRPSESISLNRKPAPAQDRQGYDIKKNAP